jgi:hypothetical protein
MTLTVEQEKQILDFWNRTPDSPPGLKEITEHLFPNQKLDGRSDEGKAIKAALAKFNLRARPAHEVPSKTSVIKLTDEHQAFIVNNVATMGSLDIAKMIFKNPALTNLNAETRAVNEFVKTLDTKVVYNSTGNQDIPVGSYEPPNTLDKVLKRANRYVNGVIDKEKLTSKQKKGLEMLINYLHTFRFIRQMNTYDSDEDRSSCEDAFIRYTYDKPDLTQEEIDQYIELSNQVVRSIKIQRRSEQMQRMLEELTTNNTDPKVSMSWVEAIGKAGTEYDQCLKRCNDLLDDLKEKRSKRLSKQIQENASILNLVQAWRFEENRAKLLKIGEREQEKVQNEAEKLMNMAEVRCLILGLNKEDFIRD